MTKQRYLNFDLLLEQEGEGLYQARVTSPLLSEQPRVQFRLPFDATTLQNLLLKLDPGRPDIRSAGGDVQRQAAKAFGGALFEAIFTERLATAWALSLRAAAEQASGLRLRLRLDDAPALAGLPWELLYDAKGRAFPAQSEMTPLVRFVDVVSEPDPIQVNGPLRVLTIISSPLDLPELDVEREWVRIETAMAAKVREGLVVVDRLPEPTVDGLGEWLLNHDVHGIHFIGHGDFDSTSGEGFIVFQNERDGADRVTADVLGPFIHDHDPLRMVVLNACRGARVSSKDPYGGMAQRLVQQGATAVVAMQFPITDKAAVMFTGRFYGALAAGLPVEQAVNYARKALQDKFHSEWATPVLFTSSPDGNIFKDVQAPSGWAHPEVTDPALEPLQQELVESDKEASLGANLGVPPMIDENVQFTVYRPRAIRVGVWYPLLAFAHLAERRPDAPAGAPDPIEKVKALAHQALGDQASSYASPFSDARGGIPREGELTFVPTMAGVDFNPPRRVFQWREDVHKEEFRLRTDATPSGAVLRGQLTVFLGAFILADVPLVIRLTDSAVRPSVAALNSPVLSSVLEPAQSSPYRKIFPSYSHLDSEIVEQAQSLGAALGDVYLRDRSTLRSGEEWSGRLLELIDHADVFQLFWSSNSMRSEYVRQEWEHAISLARPNFIRPTYWEDPMPRSDDPPLPPASLQPLHFHCLALATRPASRATPKVRENPPSTSRLCSVCGEANPADRAFCAYCGSLLAWQDRRTEPTTDTDDLLGSPSPTWSLRTRWRPPIVFIAIVAVILLVIWLK